MKTRRVCLLHIIKANETARKERSMRIAAEKDCFSYYRDWVLAERRNEIYKLYIGYLSDLMDEFAIYVLMSKSYSEFEENKKKYYDIKRKHLKSYISKKEELSIVHIGKKEYKVF